MAVALGQRGAGEFSSRVSEASEAAEKFIHLFYETIDKRRQLISGFYYDSSFLVWNGHTHSGTADISTFYQSLPNSQHMVECYDCQPVADSQSQTTVMVNCEGVVKFDGQPSEELFSQNFLLVKQGEVWKVSSDCFRFLDSLV